MFRYHCFLLIYFIAIKAKFIALMKYNRFGNYRSFWKLYMLFVSMGNNVPLRYNIFYLVFIQGS